MGHVYSMCEMVKICHIQVNINKEEETVEFSSVGIFFNVSVNDDMVETRTLGHCLNKYWTGHNLIKYESWLNQGSERHSEIEVRI